MLPAVCLSFVVAIFMVHVNAHTHDELSEQYTYSVQMDSNGSYTMFYSYDDDSSTLQFAVLVQTTGWIGLGISPNGQMPSSDVVIGWVDQNGRPFLQDRYAIDRSIPSLDESQDWTFVDAEEENGFTTLQFERKLETCDSDDRTITFGDTTYLIYSYHSQDPVGNEQLSQHEFQGSLTINLFGQSDNLRTIPDDADYFSIVNTKAEVPSKDTTYLCTILPLPEFFQNKTHYILQFVQELSSNYPNSNHVHHMVVYLCEGMNLTGHSVVNETFECDNITRDIQPCRFATIIAGWAIGGNGHTFPENVALPIGGEDKIHTHVLLEMHYDNPGERDDIIDSSGMRFYYTDQPPEINAGIITLGQPFNGHMIVPPNVARYTITGHCTGTCTNAFLPEGVTAYASFLHTHTVGEALTVRHIRDGVELDPIDLNNNYDFDFQQINYIPRVQLLPGDEILLECVYNSENRDFTTFGGESTKDEMCLSYLYYYPATNLSSCISSVNPSAYEEWLNEYVPPEHNDIMVAASMNNISGVRPIFDSVVNWSVNSIRLFERIGLTGQQTQYCLSTVDTNTRFINRNGEPITVEKPLEQTDNCVTDTDDSGSTTLYSSVITVLLCWMATATVI